MPSASIWGNSRRLDEQPQPGSSSPTHRANQQPQIRKGRHESCCHQRLRRPGPTPAHEFTRTIGTASDRHYKYLLELKLDVHIDYRAGDFRESVRAACPNGVDLVFDCVGGDPLQRSADLLNSRGRIVSITDPEGVARLGQKKVMASFVFVEPIREGLERIATMIEKRRLRTFISASMPLTQAAKSPRTE